MSGGRIITIVGPAGCTVVDAGAPDALVASLQRALAAPAPAEALVGALVAEGVHRLPGFAVAVAEEGRVRLLVRPPYSVVVEGTGSDTTVMADAGITTWSERVVADAERLRFVRLCAGTGAEDDPDVLLLVDLARWPRPPRAAIEPEEPVDSPASAEARASTAPPVPVAAAPVPPAAPFAPPNSIELEAAAVDAAVDAGVDAAQTIAEEWAGQDPSSLTIVPGARPMIGGVATMAPARFVDEPDEPAPGAGQRVDGSSGGMPDPVDATELRAPSVAAAGVVPLPAYGPGPAADPPAAPAGPVPPPPPIAPLLLPPPISHVPPAGDHDGYTVAAARSAPASAALAPPPSSVVAPAASVQAVHCAQSHPSPPHAERCRTCGQPILDRQVRSIPRPSLGLLRLGTGQIVDLTRSVVLGRNPTTPPGRSEVFHLVALSSPDQAISRSHVEVVIDGWSVSLLDLESRNGTFVTLPGHERVRLRPHVPFLLVPDAEVDLGGEAGLRYELAGIGS